MSELEPGYRLWLNKAESDLLNIENNLMAEKVPWDTVCFHAQQVAEKLLKGFLVLHGYQPFRTHDLIALLTHCVMVAPELAELEPDCQALTYYAVAVRYPDDLYEPTEAEGRRMIAAMRRVRNRLLAEIDGSQVHDDLCD